MKIAIAVPGKFHVLNYIPTLSRLHSVQRLWFSHKQRSVQDYGLDSSVCQNFPAKEYLTQAHGRYIGNSAFETMLPFYQRLWEDSVLRHWIKVDVLHILGQGACTRIIDRAKNEGTRVLCEAVNTHPIHRFNLMKSEAARWGLPFSKATLFTREERQLQECRQADAMLFPTDFVSQTYAEREVKKTQFVIPYAANHKRFDLGPREITAKNQLRIICVGQIGIRKGQLYLLDAMRELDPSQYSLTLVGTIDPLVSEMLKQYQGTFTHIERVPHLEMPQLLREHDVFVMPSLEEGLAVSICEAMASGLAVIATHESGACELIEDEANGLLIPSRSASEISMRLRLLRNMQHRLDLGNAARRAASTLGNWEKYSQRLAQAYTSLL